MSPLSRAPAVVLAEGDRENLMLSFPIIDTHLHLWDPGYLRYPWLDEIPLLNQPYLLADHDNAVRFYRLD